MLILEVRLQAPSRTKLQCSKQTRWSRVCLIPLGNVLNTLWPHIVMTAPLPAFHGCYLAKSGPEGWLKMENGVRQKRDEVGERELVARERERKIERLLSREEKVR